MNLPPFVPPPPFYSSGRSNPITAHLLLACDVVDGVPVIRGVGIYSSAPHNMTLDIDGHRFFAEILRDEGSTFQEAMDQIKDRVHTDPWYAWLRPYVTPRGSGPDYPHHFGATPAGRDAGAGTR